MEGTTMPGRSRPCPTLSSIYEPSSDDSSPSICYDIVFHMRLLPSQEKAVLSRWYKITVHADGSQKVGGDELQICPFWTGKHRQDYSFAVLGSDLYRVGGQRCYRSDSDSDSDFDSDYESDLLPSFVRSVFKLEITRPNNWVPVPKMISPRLRPHNFVIGGKLFVLDSYPTSFPPCSTDYNQFYPITDSGESSDDGEFDTSFKFITLHSCPPTITSDNEVLDLDPVFSDAEVFDPILNQWEALPDPPCKMLHGNFITAALENPDRILVASCVPGDRNGWAMFYTYDVRHGCWTELERPRKIHPACPLGWSGRAITVANTLYWLVHNARMLAYDLELDVWFLGNLNVLGNSFFNDDDPMNLDPRFVHLENHRFCFLKCASDSYLHCSIVDVSRKLKERRLDITVVCLLEYKMDCATRVSDCLLLGKRSRNEVQIREEAKQE